MLKQKIQDARNDHCKKESSQSRKFNIKEKHKK